MFVFERQKHKGTQHESVSVACFGRRLLHSLRIALLFARNLADDPYEKPSRAYDLVSTRSKTASAKGYHFDLDLECRLDLTTVTSFAGCRRLHTFRVLPATVYSSTSEPDSSSSASPVPGPAAERLPSAAKTACDGVPLLALRIACWYDLDLACYYLCPSQPERGKQSF